MDNPFQREKSLKFRKLLHVHFLIEIGLGTFVWMVWNESFTAPTILQGIIVSALSFGLTDVFLFHSTYGKVYRLHFWVMIRYLLVLIVSIFRSGIHAIHITLLGNLDICAVTFPTNATNPFHGMLIGSAITLTPGTVTLDYSGDSFTVIWIERPTEDALEAGEIIKGTFEKVLLHKERTNKSSMRSPKQ